MIERLVSAIGSVVVMVTVPGCSFTAPTAPTMSEKFGDRIVKASPEAVVMGESAGASEPTKNVIYDEAYRCEGRLSALISKMKNERYAQSTITLVGGGISAVGGVSAALVDGKDAKSNAAAIAAAGGLIAIGANIVGEPAVELQLYERAIAHYNRAGALGLRLKLERGDAGDGGISPGVEEMIGELKQCSDSNKSDVSKK